MARPIDGDALKRWCEKIIDQACHPATVQIGEVFLDKVRSMPTLIPPNEPLTLEELRAKLEQAKTEITRLKHYEDKCHDCPIVCAKREIIKAHEELESAQNERNMWKEGMEDCQQSILELEAELEQMKAERDAAIDCIYKIEDDLDRGNDNDWAREHISEWESQKED